MFKFLNDLKNIVFEYRNRKYLKLCNLSPALFECKNGDVFAMKIEKPPDIYNMPNIVAKLHKQNILDPQTYIYFKLYYIDNDIAFYKEIT